MAPEFVRDRDTSAAGAQGREKARSRRLHHTAHRQSLMSYEWKNLSRGGINLIIFSGKKFTHFFQSG